jgi:hypothetical protein
VCACVCLTPTSYGCMQVLCLLFNSRIHNHTLTFQDKDHTSCSLSAWFINTLNVHSITNAYTMIMNIYNDPVVHSTAINTTYARSWLLKRTNLSWLITTEWLYSATVTRTLTLTLTRRHWRVQRIPPCRSCGPLGYHLVRFHSVDVSATIDSIMHSSHRPFSSRRDSPPSLAIRCHLAGLTNLAKSGGTPWHPFLQLGSRGETPTLGVLAPSRYFVSRSVLLRSEAT